jgi:hypothetical protein
MAKKSSSRTLTPEQAQRILAYRRKIDPLTTFVASPTQAMCGMSRKMIRLLSGSNRSGKTSYAAVELATAAMRRHPYRTTSIKGIYIVFAISREQITDVWYSKLRKESKLKGENFSKPMIPDWEVAREYFTYGAGAPTIKDIELKNGNRIIFAVSGDNNVWKRIQGKDYVLGVCIDEQAGSRQLIDECIARMLDANSDQTVRAEAGGAWMLWSTSETMVNDTWDDLKGKALDGHVDIDYFFIASDENPAINVDERTRLKGIISDEAYDIRMTGTGSTSGNMLVYPQFDDAKHVLATDYVPTDTDTLWIGYDPGTNYTGIVFGAFAKDKPHTLRIFKAMQPRRQTLEADVQDICNVLRGRFLEAIVYDQAARKIEKVGESVYFKLRRLLLAAGVKIHRDLLMGESQYERGVPRVRYFLEPKPGAEPLLTINAGDPGCQRLRQQFKAYRFTKNAFELKGDNILRGDDHLIDALRYLITRQPCWADRGSNPMNPHYAEPTKHSPLVMSERDLIEAEKVRRSADIAKGLLPNYTSKTNLRWRR